MPSTFADRIIFYPNKGGANNALIASAKDYYAPPKNGLWYQPGTIRFMTACHPLSRFYSMWKFMSGGRMSRTSKYTGTSWPKWVQLWLKDREDEKCTARNSWWYTLSDCLDIVKPDHLALAENDHWRQALPEPFQNWHGPAADTYRNRRGWDTHDYGSDILKIARVDAARLSWYGASYDI